MKKYGKIYEMYQTCIGERYGKLVVIAKIPRPPQLKYGGDYWVKCSCDCGGESMIPYIALRYKNTKSCGCIHRARGPAHKDWKGYGEISGDYYTTYKRQARGGGKSNRTPKEFSITIEYLWNLFLKQERRCAITGVELTFDHLGDRKDHKKAETSLVTASLDRIDSSKGYIEGNVQWVHKKVNLMKNDLSQKEFIDWCKKVAENNP